MGQLNAGIWVKNEPTPAPLNNCWPGCPPPAAESGTSPVTCMFTAADFGVVSPQKVSAGGQIEIRLPDVAASLPWWQGPDQPPSVAAAPPL